MCPSFKGRRGSPLGRAVWERGSDGAAHQAAHAAGTEPTVQGQGGLPSHQAQPHPYSLAHPHAGAAMGTLLSQAEHTDAEQLAHSKLLFYQGLSNLRRHSFRSCLKCYGINSFWGTVMAPMPQKAGVGQREKGRGMEVLVGQRQPGTPAFRAAAQPWKHGETVKGGKPHVENCVMEIKFDLKYIVNIVN